MSVRCRFAMLKEAAGLAESRCGALCRMKAVRRHTSGDQECAVSSARNSFQERAQVPGSIHRVCCTGKVFRRTDGMCQACDQTLPQRRRKWSIEDHVHMRASAKDGSVNAPSCGTPSCTTGKQCRGCIACRVPPCRAACERELPTRSTAPQSEP